MGAGDVHTTYDSEHGDWVNRREGNDRASSRHDTKAEATDRGQGLARNTGSEWFGHRRDGVITERNTYGHDPYPPKG